MLGFFFILVQNVAVSRIPFYFRKLLDEITGANRWAAVRSDALMILAFTALTAVAMFWMRALIIGVSRRIEYDVREQIFSKIMALPPQFFQSRETGDLVSRCTNDLNDVRTLLGPGLMYVPNSASRFLLFLPIMSGLDRPLMWMVALLMAAVVVLIITLMPRMRVLFRHVQEAVGSISNRVWQTIAGIETIKLYALEPVETARFSRLNRWYIGRQMRMVRYRGTLWPFFVFVFSCTELLILVVGGRKVISGGMTIGQLLQFNMLAGYLGFPILSLGWIMSLIQQGVSAMGRINELLDAQEETRTDWAPLPEPPLTITLKHLTFRYGTNEAPALADVSLTIHPGETVGFTGTIGSGKSTLVHILTGILRPEPGMVFINDTDITRIHPDQLPSLFSVVPQDPFLFSRTVGENISLGVTDPAEDQVAAAIQAAGLSADVAGFPQGTDTLVGERGITLSGGQRQRTAIARALMRHRPVLILDDALSAVDSRTEERILETISGVDGRRTLVLISHRVSALKLADRVFVLRDGQLEEAGSPEELLRRGGLYARLAFLQQMAAPETENGKEASPHD